jgi:hypothetical protein
VGERHGVHHDWFERNRFLYKVIENTMPADGYGTMHDPGLPPEQRKPIQRRQAQPSGIPMDVAPSPIFIVIDTKSYTRAQAACAAGVKASPKP